MRWLRQGGVWWLGAQTVLYSLRSCFHSEHSTPHNPAGTEPWGLYNVVLFLLHDRSGSGRVSLEEAMKITYLRVGKVSGGLAGRRGEGRRPLGRTWLLPAYRCWFC